MLNTDGWRMLCKIAGGPDSLEQHISVFQSSPPHFKALPLLKAKIFNSLYIFKSFYLDCVTLTNKNKYLLNVQK